MNCDTCGKPFKSYNPNPRFCSKACKDKSLVANVDHSEIKRLYVSGKTQDEIARTINCGRKVVYNSLKRQGVKCRVAKKRNQFGDKNTSWSGDCVGYKGCHDRVRRLFGCPQKCQVCGTDDENKTYDWANLTGKYNDPIDYKRMCRSCHWKYDKKHLNFKGKQCITS